MNAPDYVQNWAHELGVAARSARQLSGGINNRVYLLGDDEHRFIIKGYAALAPGQRDRMRAEVEFLSFAGQVAPEYVPRLLHTDASRRCVILEYIEGKPYGEAELPPASDIQAALAFFRKLNTHHEAALATIPMDAAEGFLRLSEHLTCVRERLLEMRTEHLTRSALALAEPLLGRLRADLERTSALTHQLIASGVIEDAIAAEERCVSPSDFGFHNAIHTRDGVRFIDFEFAGRDDPAKTAADFVLQPRVPVPRSAAPLEAFFLIPPTSETRARHAALLPILKLKWCCIILAVLRPERLQQIVSTGTSLDIERLTLSRLELATRYQKQESPLGIR